MSFSLNFHIEANLERRVIYEKIYGLWKKETAVEYHEEFMRVAEPLIKGKWAKLINLSNWKTSYPEINTIVGEHLRWCRENGMVLSINVIENPITKTQLKKMFTTGGTGPISKLVRSQEEGEKLLTQNGF
jgi:hypothetical protein